MKVHQLSLNLKQLEISFKQNFQRVVLQAAPHLVGHLCHIWKTNEKKYIFMWVHHHRLCSCSAELISPVAILITLYSWYHTLDFAAEDFWGILEYIQKEWMVRTQDSKRHVNEERSMISRKNSHFIKWFPFCHRIRFNQHFEYVLCIYIYTLYHDIYIHLKSFKVALSWCSHLFPKTTISKSGIAKP